MESPLEAIEGVLGEPVVRGAQFLIYCGDSLSLLQKLEGTPWNLSITSPPYNIGKEYEVVQDTSAYLDWCGRWLHDVYRLTSATGALWLNLGYIELERRAKAIPIPYLLWDRIPFYLQQEVVWSYGAGVSSKKRFSPRNEKFLWYVKNPDDYVFDLDAVRDPNVKYPNQRKHGRLKCNPLGKNPGDAWYIPKVTSGKHRSSRERTAHPAQFPIAAIERIVKACSQAGDIIFDPFLGSGTVVEAAVRHGRFAVGFEIEPRYIAIAKRRLERLSIVQPQLF